MRALITLMLIVGMCVVVYADNTITEFNGSGQHTTRPFTAPDKWEIQWEAEGDIFQIYIYKANGDLEGVAANQMGPGKGSAYQPKGGSYYLTMNAVGTWKVTIVKVQ